MSGTWAHQGSGSGNRYTVTVVRAAFCDATVVVCVAFVYVRALWDD